MPQLEYVQELNQEVQSLYEYIDELYTLEEDFNDKDYDPNSESYKSRVKKALPFLFVLIHLKVLKDLISSTNYNVKTSTYSDEILSAIEGTVRIYPYSIIFPVSDCFVLSEDISFEYNGKVIKLKRGEQVATKYKELDFDIPVYIIGIWKLIQFAEKINFDLLFIPKELLLKVDKITKLYKLAEYPYDKIFNLVLEFNELSEKKSYQLEESLTISNGIFDLAYKRIADRTDNHISRLLRLLVTENNPSSVLSLYSSSQIVDELIFDSKSEVFGNFKFYKDLELFNLKKYLSEDITTSLFSLTNLLSSDVHMEDCFHDYQFRNDENYGRISIDNFIAFPPFNYSLRDIGYVTTKTEYLHTHLLKELFNELSENAKAVIVVPASFLTSLRPEDKKVRTRLIEYGMLDYVIQFKSSEKLLGDDFEARIDFVVLGISYDTSKQHIVKFIKGDLYENNVDFTAIESIYADVINNEVEFVKDKVLTVSLDTIVDEDFNLSLSRYFITKSEGVPLSDILTEMKLQSAKEINLLGDLINVKDLKSDPFVYNVDSYSELPGNKKLIRKLSTEALLVSKIFSPFKASYFNASENSNVYISQNMRCFEVNFNVVNLDYLMYVLNTTFFEDQIRRVAQGSAMKTFSIKDFLNICIDLPSIIKQKSIVLEAKKLKLKDNRYELDLLEAKLYGAEKLHRQDSAQFKHSMAQFLSGINSGVKVLKNHLTSIDGTLINVNQPFGKRERSIGTLMNQLILKVEDCNSMLLDLGVASTSNGKEVVVYVELINQLKMSILSDNFKVLVENNISESDFSDDFSEEFSQNSLTINVSVDLFKKMFQNIVDNAIKHGFVDTGNQHLLKISSSLSSTINNQASIVMEISNNGLPFPKDYDKKQFITKWSKSGNTANTGLGGSDINRVVNSFNGTFDLELDAKAEFPVKYIINIPIEL